MSLERRVTGIFLSYRASYNKIVVGLADQRDTEVVKGFSGPQETLAARRLGRDETVCAKSERRSLEKI